MELNEATPKHVQMLVSTEYKGALSKQINIEFNPRLDECDSVRVLRHTELGNSFLMPGIRYAIEGVGAQKKAASNGETKPWPKNAVADKCTVTILISRYVGNLSLTAKNPERLLGQANIRTPKNVVVLAILLPASIAADVLSIPVVLSWLCLASGECVVMLLEMLANEY